MGHGKLSVLWLLFAVAGISSAAVAELGGVYKGEEAYYTGRCDVGYGQKGWNWEFILPDGTVSTICCPMGQYPTGETKPTRQRCHVPEGEIKNCTTAYPEPFYCIGSHPFVMCCPKGQVATCDSDVTKQQCFDPKQVLFPGAISELKQTAPVSPMASGYPKLTTPSMPPYRR